MRERGRVKVERFVNVWIAWCFLNKKVKDEDEISEGDGGGTEMENEIRNIQNEDIKKRK